MIDASRHPPAVASTTPVACLTTRRREVDAVSTLEPRGDAVVVPMPTTDPTTSPLAGLRDEACMTLDRLDEASKGRASVVRSCSELRGIAEPDRLALKELLRCITEQRKRLRALRRLWQSLDGFERPSAELVEATELCLRESREMASALDPWRIYTLEQVTQTVAVTWQHLGAAANEFLQADARTPRITRTRRPA